MIWYMMIFDMIYLHHHNIWHRSVRAVVQSSPESAQGSNPRLAAPFSGEFFYTLLSFHHHFTNAVFWWVFDNIFTSTSGSSQQFCMNQVQYSAEWKSGHVDSSWSLPRAFWHKMGWAIASSLLVGLKVQNDFVSPVANKWIREGAQIWRRPCSLSKD